MEQVLMSVEMYIIAHAADAWTPGSREFRDCCECTASLVNASHGAVDLAYDSWHAHVCVLTTMHIRLNQERLQQLCWVEELEVLAR